MKKVLMILMTLLMGSIFGGTAAYADGSNPLEGLKQVVEVIDLKDGGCYFLVSDRHKFAGNTSSLPKAMAAQQDYFPITWGEEYVYWADLDVTLAAFAWIAEETADGWAFKNVLNKKYIGNSNVDETDVLFSDTPVGYVLDDTPQDEGTDSESLIGKFLMTNSMDEGYSITVQGFGRSDRADNSVAKQREGQDSYDENAATNGYPGRWLVYELTEEMIAALKTGGDHGDGERTGLEDLTRVKYLSDMKDGAYYYIVSDRTKYASNNTTKPKAMSTEQDSYAVKWGKKFVYWGDLDTASVGFVWQAVKMDNQWAFKNMDNYQYIGTMNTDETDIIFSTTPVGYTLSDLEEGAGRFTIINNESPYSLHVQGYLRGGRPDNSVAKQEVGEDNYPGNGGEYGYAGRWHFYEVNYTEDLSLKEGYYYVVSAFDKFSQPEAWQQNQTDARCASTTGAELAWTELNQNDPRHIFKVTPVEEGYTIQNYVSGQYVGGLADGVIVMTDSPAVTQTLEAVEDTEDTYIIYNSSLGENRMFADGHQDGAATKGLVGGGEGWNEGGSYGQAQWKLQMVPATQVTGIPSEKLALAQLLTGTRNPEHFAYDELNEEQAANLKAAYAAAEAGLGQTLENIFYVKLANELQAALKGEFTPDQPYDKHHFDTIRVVSYNVQHCAGQDDKLNPERTAKAINALNPTVVALQEMDSVTSRSQGVDQVKKLAELTGMYGVFCKSIDFAGGGYGNGVLTDELPRSVRRVNLAPDGEKRTMLMVELKDYVFASIHVGLSPSARRGSAPIILKAAKECAEAYGKPIIIAGDFNDDGTDGEMQGERGVLTKTLQKNFTFHSDMKTPTWGEGIYVIDHIISYDGIGGVETLSYEVIQDKMTSDHLPIVGELKVGFPPEGIKSAEKAKARRGNVYDLTGQIVGSDVNTQELADGIYIIDGRKRLVK